MLYEQYVQFITEEGLLPVTKEEWEAFNTALDKDDAKPVGTQPITDEYLAHVENFVRMDRGPSLTSEEEKIRWVHPKRVREIIVRLRQNEQEIKRHHKDFERWEEMASKGAAQLAFARIAERVFQKLREADQLISGTQEHDDLLEDAFELVEKFDEVEAEMEKKAHGKDSDPTKAVGKS